MMRNTTTTFIRFSTFGSSLLAISLLALTGCSEPAQPASAPPPATVLVAPVLEKPVAASREYVGKTAAVQKVELKARVKGLLAKRHFTEGAYVEAGEILFSIEPDQYEANHAAAKAALSNASAAYKRAAQKHKRVHSVKAGGVSASALEEANNALAQAQAQVSQAKAQLQTRALELSYTQITAPISGRISEATVDAGNVIGPETGTLATVVQLDPIHVNFAVSETVATQLMHERMQQGLGAPELTWFTPRLELGSHINYPHDGEIDYVASEINASTGTLEIRAKFPNPNGLLRPGQFVNLNVQRGEAEPRLLVPQAAVQQDLNGHYVLTVDSQGKVSQNRITVSDQRQVDWVVEEGLEAGQLVIFQGIQKTIPGNMVNAQPADPYAGLGE